MKFIRRDSNRYSKIGKNRKKLQKWRKPKGRDNKMRERRAGYPKSPSVGYKSPRNKFGKINRKGLSLGRNIKDLEKAGKNSRVIIGNVGAKKKLILIRKASEMKFEIANVVGENKNATK